VAPAALRRRASAAGFSLVEVIVAMGLLAGVLVAVAGMFVIGQREVQSGRGSTEALAVARAMMEELQGLGFQQTYGLFQEASCNANADVSCTVNTAANPNAVRWQNLLDEGLREARAEVQFESLNGGVLAAATALRIRITVYWTEGDRARHLSVATVRL